MQPGDMSQEVSPFQTEQPRLQCLRRATDDGTGKADSRAECAAALLQVSGGLRVFFKMYYANIYIVLTLNFISMPDIGIGDTEISEPGIRSIERDGEVNYSAAFSAV